jgi:acetyl-CoA C-acetyltransferase
MEKRTRRSKGRNVYIVDGSRTPFIKAQGVPGPFRASDLAVNAGRPLLDRQAFSPEQLDQVILGCIVPGVEEANIARLVALRLGCGNEVPAWTVQRNCGSGMQAVDTAALEIASGRSDLILAGGTESMSHSPVLFSVAMVNWLGQWSRLNTVGDRMLALSRLKLAWLKPVIALLKGLTDPVVGLSMGQTAEVIAHRFNISRAEMDAYAAASHQRLGKAIADGRMSEVELMYDWDGQYYESDNGLRVDSSVEKLATLKPVFDREFGKVTAGNSAQVTDGAALLILASEAAVKNHNLPVLGRFVDSQWSALEPEEMGLGPAHSIAHLLTRHKHAIKDVDYWEINEAFAAQVLACRAALMDDAYCTERLGLSAAAGEIPMDRLNVDGGGIALGHPVGASGARIILHLLHVLQQNNAQRGVASLCIGGGQGGAVLLERTEL